MASASSPNQADTQVKAFYKMAGYDPARGRVTGAMSLLAAGTWQQMLSSTASLLELNLSTIEQWHEEVRESDHPLRAA